MEIKGFTMPMCEINGCELSANFHGFGHDFCWPHYTQHMSNFFGLNKNYVDKGETGQLELRLEVTA